MNLLEILVFNYIHTCLRKEVQKKNLRQSFINANYYYSKKSFAKIIKFCKLDYPLNFSSKQKLQLFKNTPYLQVGALFVTILGCLLVSYVFHCTWVTSEAYSSPSIVLSARAHDGARIIFDDFREAYTWLKMNTAEVRDK